MKIFTVNITRVVWPHVTIVLDLQYLCQDNPLFYHLNLNLSLLKLEKECFFFGEYLCPTYFSHVEK